MLPLVIVLWCQILIVKKAVRFWRWCQILSPFSFKKITKEPKPPKNQSKNNPGLQSWHPFVFSIAWHRSWTYYLSTNFMLPGFFDRWLKHAGLVPGGCSCECENMSVAEWDLFGFSFYFKLNHFLPLPPSSPRLLMFSTLFILCWSRISCRGTRNSK